MDCKELLKVCENEKGVKFKIANGDIVIESDVVGTNNNKVLFKGGHIEICNNTDLKEKSAPGNSMINCKWCYSVNTGGRLIGYIYKPLSGWA